jgi:hypothetical protein
MNRPRRAYLILGGAFYFGGVCGAWLALTWHGFTEIPFREIGALFWPLLVAGLFGVL